MDAALRASSPPVGGRRPGSLDSSNRRRQGNRRLLAAIALLVGLVPAAATAQSTAERRIALELYVRGDEHREIRDWLTAAVDERPGVRLRVFDVADEGAGSKRFEQICKHFKRSADDSVPAIYACSQFAEAPADREQLEKKLDELRTMTVYVRSGCPRCARTKQYLKSAMTRYPGFRLVYRDVVTDRSAQSEMSAVARRYKTSAASVPLFHVCDQVLVGFDSASGTGRRLEAVLNKWTFEDKKEPADKASSLPRTASVLQFAHQRAAASRFLAVDRDTRSSRCVPAVVPLPTLLLSILNQLEAEPAVADDPSDIAAEGDHSEGDRGIEDVALADDEETLVASAEDDADFALPLPDDDMALPLPADVDDVGADPDAPASDEVQLPVVGTVRASRMGLPAFTVVIGLVDGFNPCAMWVLLFLLSILVNLQNRWKILAVAGSFVFVSGLAYFAFMAAWLNVIGLIGYEREVQVVLGVFALLIGAVHVKDFFAFKKGVSFSIPESAKPGIAARVRRIVMAENMFGAIVGAVTLAVLINIIELLCTAGLPALYTKILNDQGVEGLSKYGYLGLYNIAYMFDDALMVMLVVITLDKTRLQEKQGRWLKLVSGAFVLALGVVMLVKPDLLKFV